jgi:hypothetical protein
MTRIVTGLFDKRREVDLVVEHLVQEFDIPREQVQVHALDASSAAGARSPQDNDIEVSPADLGLPDNVIRNYSEAMRRGGILLAAWVDDDHLQRALDACQEYGARDIMEHAAEVSDAAGDEGQRTRVRAYHLWEAAGRPEGQDLEFWSRASRSAESDDNSPAARAPQQFAGETGAAPLPERDRSPDQ